MASGAGLLLFKIRSNCFPALLGRQTQGLAVYFSVAPGACLSSADMHIPCDPSPGHYPALGQGGMENLLLALPLTPTSGSLICQARRQEGGFRRMTSNPSLCRAHRHLIKLKLQRWEVHFLGDGFQFSAEDLSLHPT